jgi:protein tyrosine phosphatase (PTP) superfamily phosphohydrolase (DUF442 family)
MNAQCFAGQQKVHRQAPKIGVDMIFNFIRIDDKIATAGQPTRQQFEAIRDEGFLAVIDLAPNGKDKLADEELILQSLSLQYYHIPVPWTKPEREHFLAFNTAMNDLKPKKTFIHCVANFRVTVFFSLYAMQSEGWSTVQADDLMSRIWNSRDDYRMDNVWRSFVDDIRTLISPHG